jgi:hypothetical protein
MAEQTNYRPIEDGEDMKYDPFGYDVKQAQLIVSMKIYDVLLALLMEANPRVGADLDKLHSAGTVLGLGPTFTGFFDRDDKVSQSDNTDDTARDNS